MNVSAKVDSSRGISIVGGGGGGGGGAVSDVPNFGNAGPSVSGDYGRAYIARHAIGCQSNQEARVRNSLDDVAEDIGQALQRVPPLAI
jgi:hypothetical protein